MNENIVLFAKKLGENAELQEKMRCAASPDEAYALASSLQEGFTKDEFVAFMTKVKAWAESDGELTDEDLKNASGGYTYEEKACMVYLGIGSGVVGVVSGFFFAAA